MGQNALQITQRLDRRTRMLAFVRQHVARHVNAPSVREIQDALGYSSSSLVQADVRWLIQRGDLVRTGPEGRARSFTTREALRAIRALNSALNGAEPGQ